MERGVDQAVFDTEKRNESLAKKNEERLKREVETADELSRKLTAEMDARQGIVDAYAKQRQKIEELDITETKRNRLLTKNTEAMDKRLKEFDEQEGKRNQQKSVGDKPVLEAMDTDGRADAIFRQKFMSGKTDEAHIAELNAEQLEVLRRAQAALDKIESHTGKKTPTVPIRRG
jgi:hypothetical protein